ncbi:MAG TPA: type IV toxin-antitoxin system AbiEi family antitoxin domain-containing protein [Solirubrobacteraceae bacterium]
MSALAARQHVVFGLDQVVALGLTAGAVHKRTRAGRLHRIHRGVYSLVPRELLTREGRFMAAVLACGSQAALSHRSAAILHGLISPPAPEIQVTAPTRRSAPGIRIHRSRTLTPADVTLVQGIPCTTVARALLDLGDDLNQTQHERTLNRAEAMGRLRIRALDDQLERNCNRTAAANLRRALAVFRPRQAPTESSLEADFLALLRAHGLPEPERQVVLDLEDGDPPIRVDFMWPAAKVIIETDGREYHATRRAFERDRRRDQRLTRARWRFARVTWRQIHDDPGSVVALVIDLLAA